MNKSKKNFKFPYLSVIAYEPKWEVNWDKSDLKKSEHVLYIGEIPNCLGHCAVVKHSGEVVWLVHFQDFRLCTDDEI